MLGCRVCFCCHAYACVILQLHFVTQKSPPASKLSILLESLGIQVKKINTMSPFRRSLQNPLLVLTSAFHLFYHL